MERPLRSWCVYQGSMNSNAELPDVFSAGEIARAAGVQVRDVDELAAAGAIQRVGRFYEADAAVLAVRTLRGLTGADRSLFRPPAGLRRQRGVPLAVSGTLHAAFAAG